MKVSLVITVKDEEHHAAELIRDLEAQTVRPDECLVVDGGSTDRTPEIFEQSEFFELLHFPGNIAEGRNHGIQHATGDLIVTTDCGCRLEPIWLETLLATFQDDKTLEVDFAGGPTQPLLEDPFDLVQWSLLDQLNFSQVRHRAPTFSCRNFSFRRRLWQQCPFPEWLDHGEDAWLFREWGRLGFQSAALAAPSVRWRMRSDLVSFCRQHFQYMRGDGRAGMRIGVHSLRIGFYALLTTLLVIGLVRDQPQWWLWALAGWGSYLLLNLLRLSTLFGGRSIAVRSLPLRWWLPSILLLPGMLVLLDGSKIFGFMVGLLSSTNDR